MNIVLCVRSTPKQNNSILGNNIFGYGLVKKVDAARNTCRDFSIMINSVKDAENILDTDQKCRQQLINHLDSKL